MGGVNVGVSEIIRWHFPWSEQYIARLKQVRITSDPFIMLLLLVFVDALSLLRSRKHTERGKSWSSLRMDRKGKLSLYWDRQIEEQQKFIEVYRSQVESLCFGRTFSV